MDEMKHRLLNVLATAAIIAVAVGILIFLYETSIQLDSFNARASTLLVTTNQAMTNLRDAAAAARDASEQAKLAAGEQRAYWQKTSLETYKTMASLRLAIVRINSGITNDILPRVAKNLDSTDRLSSTAAAQLTRTMDDLQPVLVNLGQASASAAGTMGDARIREAIGRMDSASGHVDDMTAHAAGTAANLDETSSDVKAYVHRMTTPARGTWALLEWLLGLAAKSRQASGM